MGRKTNSVSLRLKKTNRDYNNCWYGDILYTENFTKSLKIRKYLSQNLNSIGLPDPQLSVIGAFKKANLLVCYLDPKKRKRLLEKSSKALVRAPQLLQASRNGIVTRSEHGKRTSKGYTYNSLSSSGELKENAKLTKLSGGLFSFGHKKQEESKALLKPLQCILENNFSLPSSLQSKSSRSLPLTLSFRATSEDEASIALEMERGCHNLKSLKGLAFVEREFFGAAKHEKSSKVEKKVFTVEKVKGNNEIPKIREGYSCYQGRVGLEFLQSNQYQGLHGSKDIKMIMGLENKPLICSKQKNKKESCSGHTSLCNVKQNWEHVKQLSLYGRDSMPLQANKGVKTPLLGLMVGLTEDAMVVKREKQKVKYDTQPTNAFSLGSFFIKKRKQCKAKPTSDCSDLMHITVQSTQEKALNNDYFSFFEKKNLLKKQLSLHCQENFLSFSKEEKEKQEKHRKILGDNFYPFFFGNKKQTKSDSVDKFRHFSNFFCDEKNYTPIISAFSKNFKIFGKKADLNLASPFECFLFGSKLVYSHPNSTVTQKVFIDKQQFSKKKESFPSFINLIGFYNGLDRFWENVVSLSFYRSTNETCCALFLADTVSYLLEKKVLFRSIKRQILLELNQSKSSFSPKQQKPSSAKPSIKTKTNLSKSFTALSPCFSFFGFENKKKVTGIRISCKGRVGGRSKKAQRSRKDTLMWGETGLHVFSSKLDFAKTHAETPFGVVGVQVWVCTK